MAKPLSSSRLFNDSSLISHWRLDGNSLDAKGRNDGTDTAMSYSAGQFSSGADFNGSTSAIIPTENTSLALQYFTISMWVKPSTNQVSRIFYSKYTNSPGEKGIGFGISDGTNNVIKFYMTDGTNTNNLESTVALANSVWSHVVIVYNGTTKYIYINGVYNTSVGWTHDASYTGAVASIGTLGNKLAQFFNGSIDDVAVFNRALTAWEIQSLYLGVFPYELNSIFINDANLIHYWRFESDYTSLRTANTATTRGTGNGFLAGVFGNAASNGGSGGLDIANTNLQQQAFTISAWIYFNANQTSKIFMSCYDAPGGVTNGWGVGVSDSSANVVKFFTSKTGGNNNLESLGGAISNLNWHHIAFTFDGTTKSIYIDGVFNTSVGWANTINYSTINGTIGYLKENGGASQILNGNIDDLAFFSRALTATEISDLYNGNLTNIFKPAKVNQAINRSNTY